MLYGRDLKVRQNNLKRNLALKRIDKKVEEKKPSFFGLQFLQTIISIVAIAASFWNPAAGFFAAAAELLVSQGISLGTTGKLNLFSLAIDTIGVALGFREFSKGLKVAKTINSKLDDIGKVIEGVAKKYSSLQTEIPSATTTSIMNYSNSYQYKPRQVLKSVQAREKLTGLNVNSKKFFYKNETTDNFIKSQDADLFSLGEEANFGINTTNKFRKRNAFYDNKEIANVMGDQLRFSKKWNKKTLNNFVGKRTKWNLKGKDSVKRAQKLVKYHNKSVNKNQRRALNKFQGDRKEFWAQVGRQDEIASSQGTSIYKKGKAPKNKSYRYEGLSFNNIGKFQAEANKKIGFSFSSINTMKKKEIREAMETVLNFALGKDKTDILYKSIAENILTKHNKSLDALFKNDMLFDLPQFTKFLDTNISTARLSKQQWKYRAFEKMIRSREFHKVWKATGIKPKDIVEIMTNKAFKLRIKELQKAIETLKKVSIFEKFTNDGFYRSISKHIKSKRNASIVKGLFNPQQNFKNILKKGVRKILFPENQIKFLKGFSRFSEVEQAQIQATLNRVLYQPNTQKEVDWILDEFRKNVSDEAFAWTFNRIGKNGGGIVPIDGIKKTTFFTPRYNKSFQRSRKLLKRTAHILNWDQSAHFFKGRKIYSSETVKKFKFFSSDKWNDWVQGTSSLFNASDAGRNIVEYGSQRIKRRLNKWIFDKKTTTAIKRALKKSVKVAESIEETRQAFANSGGIVLYSKYLLGYKVIGNYFKASNVGGISKNKMMCMMHFRRDATEPIKQKRSKNIGGKPPVIFWATQKELDNIREGTGVYWFDWSNRNKGWWKSRGGRKKTKLGFGTFSDMTFFLNFIPINAWRRSASLFSNAVNAFGDPKNSTAIWKVHTKEYWQNFTNSFIRIGASRAARITIRYLAGGLIKKSLYNRALKGGDAITRSAAFKKVSAKAFWINKFLQKGSSAFTQSAKIRLDENWNVKSTIGRNYAQHFGKNTILGLTTSARSGLKRQLGGRTSKYNLAHSNQIKLGQVRRFWSVFTPNSFEYGNLRRIEKQFFS